ncbi:ABC transporter permease [uncultured Thiohalocapsa sp.]|uniref:ABC transporter permease n=1 Tax=uncultured Thiohalocapsa sp. TaxID=768990 RepID=UPI0025D9AEAD|nr:ABC transporter permease [uncultured Thiohalocapsa sp.]
MLYGPWRHRRLVGLLIKRDIAERYRGSVLGLLWTFFLPLLMLAIYTFVFSVVFQARWSVGAESKTEFALVLFTGLLVFNFFAECFNRAPKLILGNANYVKKVVFPLAVLPLVTIGSALFHLGIGLIVWLLFHLWLYGLPPATALLFPLILLPFVVLTLGVCWFLSSLGVFLRDVAQVVSVLTTALLFLSPIFFPVDALPGAVQPLLFFNPLTPAVEMSRDVLIWGRLPSLPAYLAFVATAGAIGWLGFAWFQKTRAGFADVL